MVTRYAIQDIMVSKHVTRKYRSTKSSSDFAIY